jgi:hypothetical protein
VKSTKFLREWEQAAQLQLKLNSSTKATLSLMCTLLQVSLTDNDVMRNDYDKSVIILQSEIAVQLTRQAVRPAPSADDSSDEETEDDFHFSGKWPRDADLEAPPAAVRNGDSAERRRHRSWLWWLRLWAGLCRHWTVPRPQEIHLLTLLQQGATIPGCDPVDPLETVPAFQERLELHFAALERYSTSSNLTRAAAFIRGIHAHLRQAVQTALDAQGIMPADCSVDWAARVAVACEARTQTTAAMQASALVMSAQFARPAGRQAQPGQPAQGSACPVCIVVLQRKSYHSIESCRTLQGLSPQQHQLQRSPRVAPQVGSNQAP